MRNTGSHRSVGILTLLVFMLSGSAVRLFASSCDQPQVSFQSPGELTILSEGCSLQQLLTAVSRQTGLHFQVPVSASTVPVFAKLGPGDPTQVLNKLLAGTPFNWSLAAYGAVVLTERTALQERVTQIDDKTLSKLPPLPPGVPTAMWGLYPQLIPGIIANGGLVDNITAAANLGTVSPMSSGSGSCVSCPAPPGVDPRGDTPPQPPLCISEFTQGNRDARKVYCIWDRERPDNAIR